MHLDFNQIFLKNVFRLNFSVVRLGHHQYHGDEDRPVFLIDAVLRGKYRINTILLMKWCLRFIIFTILIFKEKLNEISIKNRIFQLSHFLAHVKNRFHINDHHHMTVWTNGNPHKRARTVYQIMIKFATSIRIFNNSFKHTQLLKIYQHGKKKNA